MNNALIITQYVLFVGAVSAFLVYGWKVGVILLTVDVTIGIARRVLITKDWA